MQKPILSGTKLTQIEVNSILATPRISGILPYKFKNGTTIAKIVVSCAHCGNEPEEKFLRAEAKIPNEHCLSLKGVVLCEACMSVTPFEGRFSDDGFARYKKADSGWSEVRYTREHSLITKLASLFRPAAKR